jgi:2-polyprenyl-3-methyl-5-hydroxy-6-metoxy-1,4-benzoquinol methylase
MTPLKNREDELWKMAGRGATLNGHDAAELRRLIAELQGSLSWRITAPLRFISKPLFRARAPKTVPPAEIGAQPPGAPVMNKPMESHRGEITEAGVIDNLATPTVGAVCNWYGVHPKFAHAALEAFAGVDYDRGIGDIHDLLARYEDLRIQFDYTFSTNTRGRNLANQLGGWGVPVRGGHWKPHKSYLDIGFAYGGSLAAFASLGYDVTGIEINEKLATLGRLNLECSGYAVDTRTGDFLSDEILSGERTFDLITCCDVIEHVMDPEAAFRKICRLLKPGGMAYVAYPTKLSIPYVRADPHSQRFGLTLLDHFRARAAYIMYTEWPYYDVSDFYEPEWFLNIARSAGVEAELVYDSSLPAPDVPGEIAALYASFSEWTKTGSQKLDPLMRHEIMRELAKYSARMFQEYSEHIAHNSIEQFARRWIDQLTRILIRKPA